MIEFDLNVALAEVPVNAVPLTDDTDFKTLETAVAYNAAGMALYFHFVTPTGAYTATAVTPTTGGVYDWAHQQQGMYTIEMPASGGASINNDAEGYGWFTGFATGVLPWRGPTMRFRRPRFARSVNAIVLGTVGSGSTTTNIVTSSLDPATAVTDQLKGRIVLFDKDTTTSALRGQGSNITGSTAGGELAVTQLTTAPVSGDTFSVN
jgi:hypothetical protein